MLKLLTELFGSNFIRRMIGTRTNVAKPIRMDYNSPYKLYSDEAFENPKSLAIIEEKIAEYAPYAMSNRNASEIANYEMNMRRLKNAKMKQAGVTEGMVIRSDLMKMTDDDLNALAKDLTKFYFAKLNKTFKISNKLKGKGYDPVTTSDKAFEKFIRSKIQKKFPAHQIIGEERSQWAHVLIFELSFLSGGPQINRHWGLWPL